MYIRVSSCDKFYIFTARKRSLGQGNIFAPVCHSVHQGVCLPQCMLGYIPRDQTPSNQTPPGPDTALGTGHPPGPDTPGSRHPPWEQTPPAEHAGRYGQCAGCTHPTGMQSCWNKESLTPDPQIKNGETLTRTSFIGYCAPIFSIICFSQLFYCQSLQKNGHSVQDHVSDVLLHMSLTEKKWECTYYILKSSSLRKWRSLQIVYWWKFI